ncbi:hypothetical protein FMEAI12_5940019 [Parafrankia sp. Ea1.12]|nr:hypothetical protein FMEAI12_5940019 [Parafrankia sp. Ea1.12]
MPLPGGDADRHFYSTDEISAAGTWDYCEATASVNGQALRTAGYRCRPSAGPGLPPARRWPPVRQPLVCRHQRQELGDLLR